MAIVHIDDAVAATVAALTAEPGVYNIVDDDPLPVAEWLPAFARWVNALEPPRLSVDNALKIAGEEAVHFHTSLSGVVASVRAAASPDRLTEIRRYRGRAGSSFPFLPRRSALIPSRTLMHGTPRL
jgi:nucleoside-diphosphate-sugar epimerase